MYVWFLYHSLPLIGDLLFYVLSILLCSDGILFIARTGYFGMTYVSLLPSITDLLLTICCIMYLALSQ